jgi:hypothetical protein
VRKIAASVKIALGALRINKMRSALLTPLLVAETSLRPAKHLKIHPTEADLLKLLLEVPPQRIVTRQRGTALRRKHQCTRACVNADLTPSIDIRCKIWR